MGKLLIIIGLVCVLVGAWILWGPKIPFLGKLPGDISIEREGFRFYFPVVTCLVISIIASVLFRLFGPK